MKINEEIKNILGASFAENSNSKSNEKQPVSNQKIEVVTDQLNENVKEEKAKEERERKIRESIQKRYVRVGDRYLKLVFRPDKYGRTQREYIERQKGTIVDDFGRKNLKYIKTYDGFCLVPSHVNFQVEINGFFNEYYPLTHKQKAGSFETIKSILNHLFNDKIDFALDYIQLLYLRPTQRLPIILLESRAKNTGKSTFGTLLKMIFQDNAIKLGNSDFESDFNAIWIKMLCIIVDETSLDKKGIMQMIKRLSTETNKVTSNEKNKAQTQIDFIGKFVFMSNDEGNALPIERGDPRFAVFKVSTFKEAGIAENPNIEQDIKEEIPAFLHYLSERKLRYPEEGRMYFNRDVYFTSQLQAYYKGNHSGLAKAIIELINDSFIMFPNEDFLRFSASDILNLLKLGEYHAKTDRMYLKKVLSTELSMEENAKGRYYLHSIVAAESMLRDYQPEQNNTRFYEFKRGQFDNMSE